MVDAVLPEEGFALKSEERHAPVAGGRFGIFVVFDDGVEAGGFGGGVAFEVGQAVRVLGTMIGIEDLIWTAALQRVEAEAQAEAVEKND